MPAPAAPPKLRCEAVAIVSSGTGPERKFQALRLSIIDNVITKSVVVGTSYHRDIAEDYARRSLWGKAK